MQAMKLLTVACMLFAGSAFGHDAATREIVDEWILRTAMNERRFEQLLASHVSDLSELPPGGPLEGTSLTLLRQALQPKNAFKLGSWILCVSPQPAADGTVLIIDSVQSVPKDDKGPKRLEVLYRTRQATPRQTTGEVWPYAVLIAYGLHDSVVCRAVP